jgi:hypothetical protein
MTIPFPSCGAQMLQISADQALRDNYFDPATIELGDTVQYRDENDGTDDRAWNDAERILRRRGLKLDDSGSGYVVVAN